MTTQVPARSLVLSGSLDDIEPTADSLITDLLLLRNGRGDAEQVLRAFRDATLIVEITAETHELHYVRHEGFWVPVFSSLSYMADYMRACGRGQDDVSYGRLTGAELIDDCLPALPRGTGALLDPVSNHTIALPPVAGIVPDSLAVDREVSH